MTGQDGKFVIEGALGGTHPFTASLNGSPLNVVTPPFELICGGGNSGSPLECNGSNCPNTRDAGFVANELVEVYNTGGIGLRAWNNVCDSGYVVKPEGRRGRIINTPSIPPQVCGGHTRWKIRWDDDGSERWSAEGDGCTGEMWLRRVGTSNDTTPPTVSITSPTNGQVVTASPFSITGAAADPGSPASGVSLVQIRNGSGTWQTATGASNWSYSLSLAQGTNQIEARSVDVAGNYSIPASVSIIYSPSTAQIMEVTPSNGFNAEGNYAGPFSPNSLTFTIFNNSSIGLAYSYSHNAPWLSNNSTSPVVMNPNSSRDVRFDLTSAANSLLPGTYATTIEFKDLTNITSTFRQMTLKVNATIPVITRQPASQSLPAGASATISVQAVGAPTLNYQWRRNGQVISNGGAFQGVNLPTLTVNTVSTAVEGPYDVIVSNSFGPVQSAVGLLSVVPDLGPCFGSWTQATTTGPSARFGAAMTFDSMRQVGVLFGGLGRDISGNNVHLGDTWIWNGQAWSQAAPAQPSDCNNLTGTPCPRSFAAMAFDPDNQHVILFGGWRFELNTTSNRYFFDTWSWGVSDWMRWFPGANPLGRELHAITHTVDGRILLFGGRRGLSTGGPPEYLDDLWQWTGFQWYQIQFSNGPSARAGHAVAYDTNRNRLVVFGGADSTGRLGDTWEWDGAHWHMMSTTGPAPRDGHAMIYTSASPFPRVVLHGGNIAGTATADTWEWDGIEWRPASNIVGQPAIRSSAAVTYDSARDQIVLFGGRSPIYGDTWVLRRPTQQAASITQQPVGAVVQAGQSVVLTTAASASGTLTYQWRRNGQTLTDGPRFVGTQSASLLISPALETDTGTYDAAVTGPCGTITTDGAFVNVIAPPCGGADFNGDQTVNTPDLTFFLGRFGQPATPGSPAERADFNADGVVNTPDLTFFLGRFSNACP